MLAFNKRLKQSSCLTGRLLGQPLLSDEAEFVIAKSPFIWADFCFPSTLQLSSFVELLMEPIEDIEIIEKVQLGLHETLVNAVIHGNSGDLSKPLRVRRILTPNWYVWQIQDEGNGLPSEARKSVLPSEIDATSGRGLFLINHCFDDIRWSRRGNRIQLASKRYA